MAEAAEALGISAATGEDYTAAELGDWPRSGFGSDLTAVLNLSAGERDRLVGAVVVRF